MLRPATPLAFLLAVALGLLVVTIISTPIINGIPLGSYEGINFGVFGWCKPDGSCSGFELGYDTSGLFSDSSDATFDLPTSTRTTLSTILVLHPVAALLTLIMLVLSIVAHFHSPAHSIRYLLFVFIISIFTLLAALLAFLIDVLLFVPHMAWGSFVALAAVIVIALCSIISCAMRRTLVSRKTRQRRIDANAEMSGENFYNRQAQSAATVNDSGAIVNADSPPPMPRQAIMPGMGGPGHEVKDAGSSDEQIPLTAQSQADLQLSNQNQFGRNSPDVMMMSGANNSGMVGQPNRRPSLQRDAYGNIIPYAAPTSVSPLSSNDGYNRRASMDRMNNASPAQRGRGGPGGPGGFRGRGGGPGPYGPPQGRGGPYGMQNGGRGGNYGPPGRGGYGGPPPNGRGGRGGYNQRGGFPGSGRGRTPPPGYRYDQQDQYGGGGLSAPPPPPGAFNNNMNNMNNMSMNNVNSSNNNMGGGNNYNAYGHERSVSGDLPRAESPPPLPGMEDPIAPPSPIGQAFEMEASVPRPQQSRFVEADDDIAGMVTLQQGRTAASVPENVSEVDGNTYVPPRAAWNSQQTSSPTSPSPVHGAAELGGHIDSHPSASGTYIEDVDPRFAEPPQPPPQQQQQPRNRNMNRNSNQYINNQPPSGPLQNPHINVPPPIISYDDIPQGSRSPAESERSNFTSISQRGINPRWNPPPQAMMPGYGPGNGGRGGPGGPGGPGYGGPGGPRRPPMRDRNDVLLNSNPDFSLPGGSSVPRRPVGGGGGGPGPGPSNLGGSGGAGMIPGSAYPAL